MRSTCPRANNIGACVYLVRLIDHHLFFFFNDTPTTEIYPLSLHDALPISVGAAGRAGARRVGAALLPVVGARPAPVVAGFGRGGVRARARSRRARSALARGAGDGARGGGVRDRKSTRLNSSHGYISYAVFCLKKKRIKRH